ncbi:MAG: DNA polymerase III subunit delta [Lachnospiraceae bacterium]|nr:DNA polymerase III subunit delta [Lachnospiraceae bacterium]
MKSIDSDIKNGRIRNIYLLIGVEPYLIHMYRDRLVNALVGSDDEINCKRYTGTIGDMNALIEYADTVPFFSDRKVLVLEDTGLFKSSDDTLASYLKVMPDTTHIIFVECYSGSRSEERKYEKALIDKRYKLYKTVHELGRIIEFKRMSPDVLTRWLLKKFSDEGLNITRNAMDRLLEYVGDDMMMLDNEAAKLTGYRLGHGSIDEDDVKAICTRNIANDIFEMTGAIASGNGHKALKLYYDLLALKESPIRILALIGREFNLLLRVKSIRQKGGGKDDIVKETGINPYFAGKYITIAERLGYDYLKGAIKDCVDTEEDFKQGRLGDCIGVELLIVKYTSKKR